MNINEVIFTSYCFSNSASDGDYLAQQVRLRESILAIYPEANLHFKNEPEETGKPEFQKSMYGFKVKLVKECLEKGFKKIIFFDAAICLNDKVDHWFEIIKEHGVLSVIDSNSLFNVTSDSVMNRFGFTREQLKDIRLIGGSVYVFDFDLPLCKDIFRLWNELEEAGYFGTQDDLTHGRLQSHRNDETCMALALNYFERTGLGYGEMRYAFHVPGTDNLVFQGHEKQIAIKRHFK